LLISAITLPLYFHDGFSSLIFSPDILLFHLLFIFSFHFLLALYLRLLAITLIINIIIIDTHLIHIYAIIVIFIYLLSFIDYIIFIFILLFIDYYLPLYFRQLSLSFSFIFIYFFISLLLSLYFSFTLFRHIDAVTPDHFDAIISFIFLDIIDYAFRLSSLFISYFAAAITDAHYHFLHRHHLIIADHYLSLFFLWRLGLDLHTTTLPLISHDTVSHQITPTPEWDHFLYLLLFAAIAIDSGIFWCIIAAWYFFAWFILFRHYYYHACQIFSSDIFIFRQIWFFFHIIFIFFHFHFAFWYWLSFAFHYYSCRLFFLPFSAYLFLSFSIHFLFSSFLHYFAAISLRLFSYWWYMPLCLLFISSSPFRDFRHFCRRWFSIFITFSHCRHFFFLRLFHLFHYFHYDLFSLIIFSLFSIFSPFSSISPCLLIFHYYSLHYAIFISFRLLLSLIIYFRHSIISITPLLINIT